MAKKEGKYYIIDKINGISFIQVIFKGQENRPLYKIFDGKECVDKWRSDEDLHSMEDYEIADSGDYQLYLNYVEDHSDELLTYDMFGLPEQSLIGTAKSNVEIKKKKKETSTQNSTTTGYYNPTYGSGYSGYNRTCTYTPPKKRTGFFDEFTKSNTLVLHKTDPTTTMLDQLYEGKGWDVIQSTYDLDQEELFRVVDAHERIVCLGHGSGYGLIGMFGPEMAPHFKDKKLFIIWCNADEYFTKHNIGQGQFVTGNMPSEVWECRAAGCGDIGKQEMLDNITYWSKLCADVVENCLEGNVAPSVEYIRYNYIKAYGEHPVTRYNSIRTKIQGTSMDENEKEVDAIYDKLGIKVNNKGVIPDFKTRYSWMNNFGDDEN